MFEMKILFINELIGVSFHLFVSVGKIMPKPTLFSRPILELLLLLVVVVELDLVLLVLVGLVRRVAVVARHVAIGGLHEKAAQLLEIDFERVALLLLTHPLLAELDLFLLQLHAKLLEVGRERLVLVLLFGQRGTARHLTRVVGRGLVEGSGRGAVARQLSRGLGGSVYGLESGHVEANRCIRKHYLIYVCDPIYTVNF